MPEVPDWAFVDVKRRLGYVAIPKVASTSIKAAMFGIDADGPEAIHAAALDRRMSIATARAKGIFIFTVVRNPFDRAVSIWRNRVYEPERLTRLTRIFPEGMAFSDFAALLDEVGPKKDLHTMAQAALLVHRHQLVVDMICRFERLGRDWAMLQRIYKMPGLPLHNASSPADYVDFYGTEEREHIKAVYAGDVRLFGYSFGA